LNRVLQIQTPKILEYLLTLLPDLSSLPDSGSLSTIFGA
jgi:hypothetical protein